ncbi:MAG: asparagine synthetase B [Bacteroidetes bacterium]|nr:asparagine synthetase B [Bacteroidota bacterium]
MRLRWMFLGVLVLIFQPLWAVKILVPMDESQKDHLKAYGISYWVLNLGGEGEWLLNYRGGSFMFDHSSSLERECLIRGVSIEIIPEVKAQQIHNEIADPEANMEAVKLLTAPKIAVYSPKTAQPWDDAVTMVLTYAEIPYDIVFDDEVLGDKLPEYDWLHLHHEDFTGQYGKFYQSFHNALWYKEQVREAEDMAKKHGFAKVSQLKLAVAKKIRDFTLGGGFLFAMCSATDSYDIALSADGVDICASIYDGDGADPQAQSKLNFQNTFAFENFLLERNPFEYEYSNIDSRPNNRAPRITEDNDYFTLFEFSAKFDLIPTLLTQNHTRVIKGFMGQTTAFRKDLIKPGIIIMGETKTLGEARYIHGTAGNGTWTFYGGHDPEDYQHYVGEPPTDLKLTPNSPGYRLILNNILFPSAKKKKQKT